MKKLFSFKKVAIYIASFLFVLSLGLISNKLIVRAQVDNGLANKLSGRILLQVEDNGEAWYLNPGDNLRYFLNRPNDAFSIMRELGLGISEDNYNKFKENGVPSKYSGKILLRVEKNGEAYYINPDNLEMHFLGRPADAFNIMKTLGLGITNTDLEKINKYNHSNSNQNTNNNNRQEENGNNENNTEVEVVTNKPDLMTNFTHIMSLSADISGIDNISEKGILYKYTSIEDEELVPMLDDYDKKLVDNSNNNNIINVDITNLIPQTYPHIRAYVINNNNNVYYGNVETIDSVGREGLLAMPVANFRQNFIVNYLSQENGSIIGKTTQEIPDGADGSAVEAVPDTNYHFVDWSDGVTDNPRTDENITSDMSVTANFAIDTYTVNYISGDNGSITGSTTQIINHGSSTIEVTPVPSEGYSFVDWSDGVTDNPRTDENITSDMSVTANFEEVIPEIWGTEIVEVTNPSTGRTWMDRNIGATRAAMSSTDSEAYGHLFQWGRNPDGYELKTSGATTTLSINDIPGHSDFIIADSSPNDWRSPQNDNLWQGIIADGWRLPTIDEWATEIATWDSENSVGAFNSILKLPKGGERSYSNGNVYVNDNYGNYWSSSIITYSFSSGLGIAFSDSDLSQPYEFAKASGISVRLIKD